MGNQIENITIVGGGTAGWMSAVYLATHFGRQANRPGPRIALVESPNVPTVGVGEATVPSMRTWLEEMEIDENEFLLRCNGSFKLGVRFRNWDVAADGTPGDYMHPFQILSSEIRGINIGYYFHAFGNPDGRADATDALTPAMALMRAGRAPRGLHKGADDRYGYHLDAGLFAGLLKEVAVARGVEHVLDDVDDVQIDEKGFITNLQLRQRGRYPVELVIDCTGFKGLLINKALGEPFEPYGKSLLCDRALAVQIPHKDLSTLVPYTQSTALGAGWSWRVPLQSRIGTGYVFSSAFRTDEQAMTEFLSHLGPAGAKAEPRALSMRVGRTRRSWVGNCVAIGLSSGFIEPLESTAIFLIQWSLTALGLYLPDRTFDPVLARRYNSVVEGMYDEIRDFIVLHYCASNRADDPFWEAARNDIEIPDVLRENLEVWSRVLPSVRDVPDACLFNYWSYMLVLFGKRYYDGVTFPIQGSLQAADWPAFGKALDNLKSRQVNDLPDHADLIIQLRAQAEAAHGITTPTTILGQTARPTIPLPGQSLQPEIRFSPGVLSEAHIL